MTDAKQTKCPHCGSTFRISDAQLTAKGGSVRCGSCLQVFRADMHLVGANNAPAPAPVQATPKKGRKESAGDESWALTLIDEREAQTTGNGPAHGHEDAEAWQAQDHKQDSDDDFGFNEDDISDFINNDTGVEIPQGKSLRFDDELSDLIDSADDSSLITDASQEHHALNENADESWAKNILSELEQTQKKQDSTKYGMEILDGKSKAPPKNAKMAVALGVGKRVADEPETPRKNKAMPNTIAAPAPDDDFLSDDADVLSFLDNDDLSSNSPAPLAANPFSLERPLAHVDAPLVLKPQHEPINWGSLLTWSFLCLVAVAMFIAQYIYFNFDSLVIRTDIRPYFEQACARFDCRLPDIPDYSKIRIDELVVRKHPKVESALQVDAILKNNATFPQSFPTLRLRFSNSADEIVASRLLKPSEYLAGEARLLRRMPPDTPIRISLNIVDPGKSAVNYGLDPVF